MSEIVIKNLPFGVKSDHAPRWACGCRFVGGSMMPHYCPTHNAPPVIEFIGSGIANLDAARRREHRAIDATATLCVGMVIGALIVSILFVLAH